MPLEDFKLDWNKLIEQQVIHINEQLPALAIIELLRVLVDTQEDLISLGPQVIFDSIVSKMFTASVYDTSMGNICQKVDVEMLEKFLPRHLELIYLINFYMIEKLKEAYPEQGWTWERMSFIEESNPKMVRFDRIVLYACSAVNDCTSLPNKSLQQPELEEKKEE